MTRSTRSSFVATGFGLAAADRAATAQPPVPAGLRPARRHLRMTLAVAGLALAAALAQTGAWAAPVDEAAFVQASARFTEAQQDRASASIEAAAAQFKALADADPADPVLRAYAGASHAMRASTTLLPWRKMAFAEDGLAQIDQALARLTPAHDAPAHRQVPAVLEVRFTAASTFLALPALFKRGARGEALLAEVVKSPLLAQAPLAFQGTVWLKAGQQAASAGRKDEARQWFDQVVARQAPQAAAAQAGRQAL